MAKPRWDSWYKTGRWQRIRRRQLETEPVCRMCLPQPVLATVCDHIEPHRGDPQKFWRGPFQSLCAPHHNSAKQSEEKGGRPKPKIGLDGWPE